HKYVVRKVTWGRRWSENWQPDLLNGGRQFSPSRALLDHAGTALPIHSTKVRRKARRYQRAGPIRNGQAFQKLLEREVLLLEKCDMFFQWHGEILAGTLRRGLGVRPAHGFFPAFHWR